MPLGKPREPAPALTASPFASVGRNPSPRPLPVRRRAAPVHQKGENQPVPNFFPLEVPRGEGPNGNLQAGPAAQPRARPPKPGPEAVEPAAAAPNHHPPPPGKPGSPPPSTRKEASSPPPTRRVVALPDDNQASAATT